MNTNRALAEFIYSRLPNAEDVNDMEDVIANIEESITEFNTRETPVEQE